LNGATNFAAYTNLVNRYQNGTFPSPQTGLEEPVYVNTWAFQYNLTNASINNYHVDFSAVTHAQVYAIRWDSSSMVYNTPVVPEPSVVWLLSLSAMGLLSHMLRKYARNN
jgi:hypothetical protein